MGTGEDGGEGVAGEEVGGEGEVEAIEEVVGEEEVEDLGAGGGVDGLVAEGFEGVEELLTVDFGVAEGVDVVGLLA